MEKVKSLLRLNQSGHLGSSKYKSTVDDILFKTFFKACKTF